MTGTVWDPVITGTPMRLRNQVLSFGKYKNLWWCVVTSLHRSDCGGYHRCRDYNYTSHAQVLARVSADEYERQREWLPLGSVKRHNTNWLTTINPVPSTKCVCVGGLLTGKIHSRQFLRGMHINRFQTTGRSRSKVRQS